MGRAPGKLLLVIVAKAPEPGQVKTRLFPRLSPEEAKDLYHCFLQDRIAEIGRLKGIDLAICYTPEDSERYFRTLASNGFQLFPQCGNNLGERLNHIFVQKLAEGYDAISIIDSDTPDLPKSIVQESFQVLMSDQTDAVFGPCYDGGYYLVGLRETHPELFRGIPWSTSTVLQDTLEIAERGAIKTTLLTRWNDLDTFEDLLSYYHKHKGKPHGDWAGEKTLRYLSRVKGVRQHVRTIDDSLRSES